MIPKRLHHIWTGLNPIPHVYEEYLEEWQLFHPDWEHYIWTPGEISKLCMQNKKLYDAGELEAPNDWLRWRADIVRLEILNQYGGIYVDMDSEPLKPLDPLLDYPCFFAETPNKPGTLTQAVCGCIHNHPFIQSALDALPENTKKFPRGSRIHNRVGPAFLEEHRKQWVGSEVSVLPWHWFSGLSIEQREAGMLPDLTGSYCHHRYDNTRNHRDSKKQVAAFHAAAAVLDGCNANWFICFGIMLGSLREGRLLPWDGDIDLGVWPEDMPKVRDAFRDTWCKITRDRAGQLWVMHGDIKIDIHVHYIIGDKVFVKCGKREEFQFTFPKKFFETMTPTVVCNRKTQMPYMWREYLVHNYGNDWTVPKRKWDWKKDPKNIEKRT